MLTEKERQEYKARLEQLKKQEALLSEGSTEEKTEINENPLKRIQKKQAMLQMQVAKIRRKRNKKITEKNSSAVVESKNIEFDPDLVKLVESMKGWDSIINYYLYETPDEEPIIPEQPENIIPQAQQQSQQGEITSGAEGVQNQESDENADNDEQTQPETEEQRDATEVLNDIMTQLKALNTTILQLKQFEDSVLPDELQNVEDEQSKLQKRVDDVEQQGQSQNVQGMEGQEGMEGQSQVSTDPNMQGEEPKRDPKIVMPSDIQEAIDRRDLFKEAIQKLIAIDEKYHGKSPVKENAEEEAKEQAMNRLTQPDDKVKKELEDLKDQIDNLVQNFEKRPNNNADAFIPPTPVKELSTSGADSDIIDNVPDSKPEDTLTIKQEYKPSDSENRVNSQRKQLITQQQTIKKLQSELAQYKK